MSDLEWFCGVEGLTTGFAGVFEGFIFDADMRVDSKRLTAGVRSRPFTT